jgi:hypothetical protein
LLHLSSIFHQFPPFHFNTHHQSLPRVVGPYTKLCCPFRVYFICPPFFSFQYTSHVYDINFPYLQIIYVWLDLVYKVNVHVRSYCFATALTSCQNPPVQSILHGQVLEARSRRVQIGLTLFFKVIAIKRCPYITRYVSEFRQIL